MISEAEFVKRFSGRMHAVVVDMASGREERSDLMPDETENFARAMYKLLFMQSEPEGTA